MQVGQTSKGRTSLGNSVDTTGVTTNVNGSNFYVAVITGVAQAISTPTDNFSNIYSLVRNVAVTLGPEAAVYECINGIGGASHVVSCGITGGPAAVTGLFLEMLDAGARDKENGVEDDASPFTSPSVSTVLPVELLIGMLAGNSSSNPATHAISSASPASGWTIQSAADETNGASFWTGCLATQLVGVTGAYNSGFTETGSGSPANIAAFITTYKRAAPGLQREFSIAVLGEALEPSGFPNLVKTSKAWF